MANDWQNALQSLLSNGNLPEGTDPAPEQPSEPGQSGKLIVDVERKGRAGKTATIISGFTIPDEEIKRLATELKSKLGAGGSARGGEILIQGERRDAVCNLLRSMGYKV